MRRRFSAGPRCSRRSTRTDIDAYRKAEAHFRQALERDPQNMSAFIGLGTFHTNVAVQRLVPDSDAHFEKAREILTQAAEREPRNPNALYQLGILLQGTRQVREALRLFEKVTELNPSNAGAHAHTGHALARLGEPEKGIEHIRYAMRLGPRDAAHAIWNEFIGNAELELSRYQAAVESFERSAALAPRYPRAWAGAAAAYALAGDIVTARAQIEKLKAVAVGVPADELLKRFGRNQQSRLHAGLRFALAPPPDAWQSPRLPSERRADGDATRLPQGVIPIAIAPFVAADGDEAGQLLADIIAEDLGNTLSRAAGCASSRGRRHAPMGRMPIRPRWGQSLASVTCCGDRWTQRARPVSPSSWSTRRTAEASGRTAFSATATIASQSRTKS